MKLKVLVDNNTYIDQYYLGEPALSFYLEDEDKKILFDTGYSDVLIKNAKKMDIDLSLIDYLILSHGHNDHTGGLRYLDFLKDCKLICHPNIFENKIDQNINIGSFLKIEQINNYFSSILLTKEPYNITNNLIYLGEIPRIFKYENNIIGKREIDGKYYDDYLLDDSALAYKTKDGLFIITGCSHSGICNIVEYAKKITNNNKIIGIIGGLHLFKDDEKLRKTIAYLKMNNIKNIYPCHCVDQECKFILRENFHLEEIAVNYEIIIH